MFVYFFFFNDTATTEIYTYLHTLSLHDALPISQPRIAAGTVLFLDVPLAFLAPAEADRAIWNRQFAAGLVVSQRLPFRVVGFAQAAEVTGAQEAFRHQAAISALFQAHQQRHVGVDRKSVVEGKRGSVGVSVGGRVNI